MRLRYLPANQAWAFCLGDSIVRMGDGPRLFTLRGDALEAAGGQGLNVGRDGAVSVREAGR